MALHNTQCPHCFTTYVISDEQLRVSEGMVRCGTCRERFQARILTEQNQTPRFDPREAFIEPLSEDSETLSATKELLDSAPLEISFANPHTESEMSINLGEASIADSIQSEMSVDIDDDSPATANDTKRLSAEAMLANIRAKQRRQLDLKEQAKQQALQKEADSKPQTPGLSLPEADLSKAKASTPAQHRGAQQPRTSPTFSTQQTSSDIAKPSTAASLSTNLASSNSSSILPSEVDKEALIDQVDSLVDNKLLNTSGSTKAVDTKPNGSRLSDTQEIGQGELETPFQLDRKPNPKLKSYSWLLMPPLLVAVVLLSIGLTYQLWMKQILVLKNDSLLEKKIVELSIPMSKKLAEYDVVLPMRRNLSQLELTSAKTEIHPSRPSTTLLKISIINHAKIRQQLPWLEMSLMDADGRLVSRRNLSPSDYVYQNATDDLIGARELKKITIELLSFPKQATGYELKILNK